jgi:hypothetical protein
MDPKALLNEIIIWYESRKDYEELMKKNEDDLNKGSFFSKVLGFGANNISKEDESSRKKIN